MRTCAQQLETGAQIPVNSRDAPALATGVAWQPAQPRARLTADPLAGVLARGVAARADGRAIGPSLARTPVADLVADKPWIYTCTVTPYRDALQFGHSFTIDLALVAPDSLHWLERTAQPYVEGMKANEWTNMYNLVGAESDVFADWGESGERRRMVFVDPPSIRKTPNNARTLEFYLHFVGEGNAIVIQARQDLATDDVGNITSHGFTFTRQEISASATLSNPLWEAAD